GKVVVGDPTLLFQFVVPPPAQPRPQLPAAVVGGFVAGIDWPFTAFILSSFLPPFGFVIYLENARWPGEPTIATTPDRVAEMICQEPEVPRTPPPVEVTETETEETEVAEADTSAPPSERPSSSSSSSSPSSGSGPSQGDSDARLAIEQAQQ